MVWRELVKPKYMHYSQQEKHEIIRIVEGSDLGVIRTLRQLKINKSTFYKWYNSYQQFGYDGLARRCGNRKEVWNKINSADRDKSLKLP